MTEQAGLKFKTVKYYPPISLHNGCRHDDDYHYVDSSMWRDTEGQHVVNFIKCDDCNTMTLEELIYD